MKPNALQQKIDPFTERLNEINAEIEARFDADAFALPERPEVADPAEYDDEEAWLFDSERDYFDQLSAYKRHENGEIET